MMFRALILTSLISAANAQGCSVCGDGKEITDPDAIFSFPGQTSVGCALLQTAGQMGNIPLDQCPFLPGIITICKCENIVVPTQAPVAPTAAPVVPMGTCPPVPVDGCNVCGEGKCVGNADNIFEFPGQPPVPCGQLQIAGFTGQIPLNQCSFLAPLIGTCGCTAQDTATPAPVAPTSAPVAPTAAPITPTMAPQVVPTAAPVTAAPVAPITPTPFPVFVLTPAPVDPTNAPEPTSGKMGKGSMEKGGMGDKPEKEDGGMGMSMRSRRLGVTEGVAAGVRGV